MGKTSDHCVDQRLRRAAASEPGHRSTIGAWSRLARRAFVLACVLFALSLSCAASAAPAQTPEVQRALRWLVERVLPDRTVAGESDLMAHPLQVRCEVSEAFILFGRYPTPLCQGASSAYSELLARGGTTLSPGNWTGSGAAAAATDHPEASAVDTVWAIANRAGNLDAATLDRAVEWLLSLQRPDGALQPTGVTDPRAFFRSGGRRAGFSLDSAQPDAAPADPGCCRLAAGTKGRAGRLGRRVPHRARAPLSRARRCGSGAGSRGRRAFDRDAGSRRQLGR